MEDAQDLPVDAVRWWGISGSWGREGGLTPSSSPDWRASHFVTTPTVLEPVGSAARAILNTS